MSRPLPFDDPARWLLDDEKTSVKLVHRDGCYICEDPEFEQMGLPLCKPCFWCGDKGHVPADNTICDDCGRRQPCCADEEEAAKRGEFDGR